MMVHTYFKEDDKYKVKMFLNMKAMFVDPIKAMEDIIEEYEKENNCSLGSDRETKILNLPESYLEEKEIRVFEQELDKEDVEEVNYSLHLQASLLKWGLLFSTLFVTTEVAKQFTRWWDTQTTSDHTIPKASWASYLPVDRLKVLHRKPIPCDNSILLSNGQSRWRYKILVFKVR